MKITKAILQKIIKEEIELAPEPTQADYEAQQQRRAQKILDMVDRRGNEIVKRNAKIGIIIPDDPRIRRSIGFATIAAGRRSGRLGGFTKLEDLEAAAQ